MSIEELSLKTPVEAEAENFTDFVLKALEEKQAFNIIRMIEEGKINLSIYKNQAITTGNAAETAAENEERDFDPTDHLLKRAQTTANELIEKYQKQ